ncbi:hypothetical protein GMOD_00005704 [Pyrenophora seminiperda CCB06]|uniref:DUF7872 domain-containing protein n=1 Tax=Pyrenophora seminiperda CCB06 TaxID=1302712 RepID=A0A3M7M9I5_9PLEO|nr:hypothetical protein GMOD_00005704 [Pyrenophora seminiperda CCB06]
MRFPKLVLFLAATALASPAPFPQKGTGADSCKVDALEPATWTKLKIDGFLAGAAKKAKPNNVQGLAASFGAPNFFCGLDNFCNAGQPCVPIKLPAWYAAIAIQNWNNYMNSLNTAITFATSIIGLKLGEIVADVYPDPKDDVTSMVSLGRLFSATLGSVPFTGGLATGVNAGINGFGYVLTRVQPPAPTDKFVAWSKVSSSVGDIAQQYQAVVSRVVTQTLDSPVDDPNVGIMGIIKGGPFLGTSRNFTQEDLSKQVIDTITLNSIGLALQAQKIFIVRFKLRPPVECKERDEANVCNGDINYTLTKNDDGRATSMIDIAKVLLTKYGFTKDSLLVAPTVCFDKNAKLINPMLDNQPVNPKTPCLFNLEQRRASAVANRKSKPSKPAGPPPIRHKAKQKAIHNARRGRGGRGGRGGGRGGSDGGRFSQDRARWDQQRGGNTMDQDFVPLSSGGNEFNALYRARRTEYTEYTDESSLDMDWPFNTDSETDFDDEDMYDSDDIAINVQATLPVTGRSSRPARAQVMFTVAAAVDIFETMRRSKYPLNVLPTRTRYDLFQVDTSPDSGAYISVAPSPASRRLSGSSATSEEAAAAPKDAAASEASIAPEVRPTQAETYNPARETYNSARETYNSAQGAYNPALAYNRGRDYVFDWGVKKGQRFHDVYADKTHNYLDSIAGKLYTYKGKHPGLEEAFEYYMPGKARLEPLGQKVLPQPLPFTPRGPSNPSSNGRRLKVAPSGPSSRGAPSGPSRGAASGPSSGPSSSSSISDTWKFPKGMHKGSRLHEVPSGYIKAVQSNSQVQKTWPGFVEALRDFKGKGLMV